MQIAYQFPERVERLVLVSSGGLGRQLTPVLRAAALPGAELVLPLLAAQPLVNAGTKISGWMQRIGLRVNSDIAAVARGLATLHDIEARRAFVHTARAVIEVGGQRVSATDKLYLAEAVPKLIVWGDRDQIIPVRHGVRAHDNLSGSRLAIFEGAGHYPHHDDPLGFSAAITDFVDTTSPYQPDEEALRRLLLDRAETNV
jgi:pimeloyl-ACP methyl ester carboxylesterase